MLREWMRQRAVRTLRGVDRAVQAWAAERLRREDNAKPIPFACVRMLETLRACEAAALYRAGELQGAARATELARANAIASATEAARGVL